MFLRYARMILRDRNHPCNLRLVRRKTRLENGENFERADPLGAREWRATASSTTKGETKKDWSQGRSAVRHRSHLDE